MCEHLHLPLQSGSDRTLARMHRGYTAERYLERLAAARAAIPDLAVTTDLIVGFPGETDDDFERTLEVVDAAAYDAAYTFVFSPRPGTPAAEMVDDFVAARGRAGAHAPAHRRGRAARAAPSTRRGSGGSRRCWSRARRRRTPTVWSGRTRQNKLVHFAPDGARLRAGGTRRRRASPTPRRTGSRGELVGASPRAAPARASASPSSAAPVTVTAAHLALVGPTASGKSALALARRRTRSATSRSSRSTRCRSTAGSTSAPPSRRAAERARGAAPPDRRRRPDEEWSVARFQRAARAAVADIEARGKRALLVGGTGLYVQAVVDAARRSRREDRAVRAELEAEAADARRPRAPPTPSSQRVDPVAAARIEPGNARRIVRALEVIAHHRPAVLVVRARPRTTYGATVFPVAIVGVWLPPRRARRAASTARVAAMRDAGLVDEVRGARRTRRRCPAPPARRSGTRRSSPTSTAREPSLDAALDDGRRAAPGGSPAASACGSGAIPASPGSAAAENPCDALPALLAMLERDEHRPPRQAPRHRQRLPRVVVARRRRRVQRVARRRTAARSATATAASAPTA